MITGAHLSPDVARAAPSLCASRVSGGAVAGSLRARVDALEASLLEAALQAAHGNKAEAARALGLSRFGLHKMMKRLGLDAP